MRSIKQIRENIEELSEALDTSSDNRKLSALVRAGLFDSNRLSMLRRALNKENAKITRAERDALLEVLDKLMEIILSSSSVYNKVKQGLSETELKESDYILSEATPTKSDIDITMIPPMIVMKRRAIRVFPDGQKVALYWADRIGKYISVPFQSIGISEGVNNTPKNIKKTGGVSLDRAKAAYYERMKRAAKAEPGSTKAEIEKAKAERNWERVDRKTPEQSSYDLIKTAAKGRDKFNRVKDRMERKAAEKEAGSWKNIGNMAASGQTSVATGLAIAKGVRGTIKGIKKIVKEEELEESPIKNIASKATKLVKDTLGNISSGNNHKVPDTTDKNKDDAENEKTTKEPTFSGKNIKIDDPFTKAKKNRSDAEDKRMERLNKAASRAVTGRSTNISETINNKEKDIK